MKYSLGFNLDSKTKENIDHISNDIMNIFKGQGIPARWIYKDNYQIVLHNFSKLPFIKRKLLERKIHTLQPISEILTLYRVKIGVSGRMKDLIYISIDKGGEYLRHIKSQLINEFKLVDNEKFVPHIVIGRVSKDLTKQEHSNLIRDIDVLQQNFQGVEFYISNMELICKE